MTDDVGKTGNHQPTQMRAAAILQQAAGDLAESLSGHAQADNIAAVLTSLTRTQESLDEVYVALAAWHERTAGHRPASSEFDAGGEFGFWMRAELALREAAQYGANVASALTRARHASQEAQWFREESGDER